MHLLKNYDTIINCIACTDTYGQDRKIHWDTNYKAVDDLVVWCKMAAQKLVHISTDYIYAASLINCSENDVPAHNPNWYSYTKTLGDAHIQLKSDNYLLIRCSHKPKPFPYDKASAQIGNFDYVDVIASLIIKLINKGANGIFNVGTEHKCMQELAQETVGIVQLMEDSIHPTMPFDISMDVSKMQKFLNDNN